MRQIICLHDGLILVSLACVSSETHNPQPVFLRIYGTKGESLCQAFLAETVETGNKNRWVTEATHVLRKKAFRAFLKRVGPRILSLESVGYFGTIEHY